MECRIAVTIKSDGVISYYEALKSNRSHLPSMGFYFENEYE